MPYKKWEQIEAKYAAPMAVVLEQMYEKYGSTKLVADELHTTSGTIIRWRKALDCEVETTMRLRCKPAPRDGAAR